MIEIFKALGDESRLRIISMISECEACACEIEGVLKLSQSNASRHLGVLKRAGIIKARKAAQWVYFSINEEFVKNNTYLFEYIKQKFQQINLYANDYNNFVNMKKQNNCCKVK